MALIITIVLTALVAVALGFGKEQIEHIKMNGEIYYTKGECLKWTLKRKRVVLCILVPIIMAIICSISIVPTGYTGVKTTFGQINENPLPSGLNFKIPFVQTVELVNNKQQDLYSENQIWGESSERTATYGAQITVSYKINPEKSAWIYANVTDYKNTLIPNDLIASAIKSAMVQLDSTKVTQRSFIEPLSREMLVAALNEKYGENVIDVLKVTINDMDFEESYKTAIANKQIAVMQKEQQDIENQKIIEKAEADAKATITQAQAQAEANNLLQESLNEEVLYKQYLEKWDGKLPQVTGSDSTVVMKDFS